ncbi:hypothetical protein ACMXYX_14105 [Neptuniibacter sp. QD72_48]|uniref:hypothetical protein n=1 Tax=Neptuniibacter sp. QD72_48 TaxID=3398214 RepID=UPI0039F582A6
MGYLAPIAEALKSGDSVLLMIVVAMSLYVAARAIWNFINEIQDRKSSYLKGSLEINDLSEDTKFVVKESLERVAFYRATGISGDPYIRNLIANLLRATQGQFSIRGINRAKDYIDVVDGQLVILLSMWKRIHFYIGCVFCVVSFLLAIAFWVTGVVLISNTQGVIDFMMFFVLSVLMMGIAVYSIWEVAGYLIAKDLDEFLKKHPECKGNKLTEAFASVAELKDIAA